MSELVDEAPKLIGDEEAPKLNCGFCRKGVEAKDVCGKLWNDPVKGCTAHQRCMQYSAGLAQYTMKRFGGFKVAKVLKEQCRGKRLKCFICSSTKMKKRQSSFGAATAGCAWHKCRKTFHFYCARKNSGPVACKMVEIRENGEKIDHYCVFCSEEHKLLFTKKLKNPVQNAMDTDDEAYKTDISSSSDSDESEDESSVESVEKPDATQKRPRLESSESLDSIGKSGEEHRNNIVTANRSDKKENFSTESVGDDKKSKEEAVVKRKCNGDGDLVDTKRSKVESASSDDDSGHATSELVICFVEQAERVNGPVKEALERAACTRFNLPPKRVFVWQYNGQRLSSEHFVYLLNEIGKALVNGDHATVSRLVFRMQLSDLAEFNEKISHNSTLDVNARSALYRGIRQQIARNFKKASEQSNRRVCSYCSIVSDGYNEEVAFVLITKELMHLQENLETIDEDKQENKDTAKNVKGKSKESSRSGTHCSTSEIGKQSGEESCKILGTISKNEKTTNGKPFCKVKERDERRLTEHHDKKKTDLVNSKSQSVNKIVDATDRSGDVINENRHKKQKSPEKGKDPAKTKRLETESVSEREKSCNEKKNPGKETDRRNKKILRKGQIKVLKTGDSKEIKEGEKTSQKSDNKDTEKKKMHQQEKKSSDDVTEVCEILMVNMLYVWNEKISLIPDTCESRAEKIVNVETEFTRIKEYLTSRIDASTALQRYPSHYDIPLLSPEIAPLFSVTNRLVNFFVPAQKESSFGTCKSSRTTTNCRRSLNGSNNHLSTRDSEVFKVKSDEVVTGSASSIVFVGPFDPQVVRHDVYVRRRIATVLDSIDDNVVGDVCCVTDVGQDVQLTRIVDIIGMIKLRSGTSIRALTGVDPQFNPASVVLLLISMS